MSKPKDFTDELVKKRTKRNPEFPKMVKKATKSKKKKTDDNKDLTAAHVVRLGIIEERALLAITDLRRIQYSIKNEELIAQIDATAEAMHGLLDFATSAISKIQQAGLKPDVDLDDPYGVLSLVTEEVEFDE
jgi:hypothetical protein